MTKTLCTNKRLWLVMVTLALAVIASLALSQDPVAAQDAASEQYGEATSSPIATPSPAEPGDETTTTAPPSDTQNESGDGEAFSPAQEAPRNSDGGQVPPANTSSPGDPDAEPDSGPILPSILADLFSQGEPGTGNTTAPSVPQAAVEGLLSGLNELRVNLNSLLEVFPFAAEQPAKRGAETNTTAGSEVTEVHSANPEPASDPNVGQVSTGTTKVTDCNGQEVILDDRAAEVVRLHNEVRAAHGLESLCVQTNLMKAAQGHAEDMLRRGYDEHVNRDGLTDKDRTQRAGYVCDNQRWPQGGCTIENIYSDWGKSASDEPGSRDHMRQVVEAWMNSKEGHRENNLDPDMREIGIGLKIGQSPGKSGTTTEAVVEFGPGK